jgi:predicted amidophosphoribosyltransferase
MFCPGCGSQINEGIKFCKQCGANLLGIRESMTRPGGAPFDWSKTWVAEMLMSEAEYEKTERIDSRNQAIQ